MTPRLILIGPGRSGTGYISTVLQLAGRKVGHEAVFNPATPIGKPDWKDWEGDASWIAVPHLPLDDTLVCYQRRSKFSTVESLVASGLFHDDRPAIKNYRRVIEEAEPAVFEHKTPSARAVDFYLRWTARCRREAAHTWSLGGLLGSELERERVAGILDIPAEEFHEACLGAGRINARESRPQYGEVFLASAVPLDLREEFYAA